MRSLRAVLVLVSFLLPFVFSQTATAAISASASIVKLRTSCYEVGVALDNCFTTMAALQNWVHNTRTPKPTAAAPLSVDIGPGAFGSLAYYCDGTWGYTTFRGAGRKNTSIGGFGGEGGGYSVNLLSCTSMMFQDLTIGPFLPVNSSLGSINWKGVGTSVWQDVDVLAGQGYGWQDVSQAADCLPGKRGAHYWFNSRIVSTSVSGVARPYVSVCAEDWFFGSEITINPGGISSGTGDAFALKANGSEIHFYGGVLRAITGAGITAPAVTSGCIGVGIACANGGTIHIHGTGIDVLSTEANQVGVLVATPGGTIHASEVAYNLSTGAGGSVTRILNNGGHIHAPYVWEHLPSAPNYTSVTGADMTTIISASGNHPHLVIYDSTCASKWFDTTTNACK